jgi:hypothetical protein
MPNYSKDLKKNIDDTSNYKLNDKTKRNVNSGGTAKPKDRTEDLSTVNNNGKSDIDRSNIKLENKKIIEGHDGKDRTKTNEGVRGVDGHKPIKIKDLNNVLDGTPEPEKKEIKAENLYKDSKPFVRKTDSLTNVYTKK